MATLPRYETMGVQYADLPRVSTAPQQAAMEGFSRMSQSLDRMVTFIQGELETKAQREAKKYAVENPPTEETIRAAMRGEKLPKIKGAGEIFQQTYEATQGALLASQLQAEGDRVISTALARIKEGVPVDLAQTRADLKDMIDGYATAVSAFSPEQSIKLRAALSLSGNTLFSTAAEEQIKRERAAQAVQWKEAAEGGQAYVEALIQSKAGEIDPATGKQYDIQKLLQISADPFLKYVETTGDRAPYEIHSKIVARAKMGAVTQSVISSVTSPSQALDVLAKGNIGRMSSVWQTLDQNEQEKVRQDVLKFYSDKETARRIDAEAIDKKAKADGIELRDQFYKGKITPDQLVSGLKALGVLSPEELKAIRTDKPDEFKANDRYMSMTRLQIERGQLGQAELDAKAEAGNISWRQHAELSKDLNSRGSQMSQARAYINATVARITDSLMPGLQKNINRAAEVYGQLLIDEEDAKQTGKPFNPLRRAQELSAARLRQDDVVAENKLKDDLRKTLSDFKLKYREDYTDETLKNAGINDPNQRSRIMFLIRAIQQD